MVENKQSETAARQPSNIHRVLIVEDDYHLADWLAEVLEHQGYTVDVVGNGKDALDYTQSALYDAVICDVMLPRVDGEQVYRHVSSQQPYLADKFLFMTGDTNVRAGLADFASRSGNLLLSKPFDLVTLCDALDELAQR